MNRQFKALKPRVLCLGMGCGFFLSMVLVDLPAVRRLEVMLQDWLATLQILTLDHPQDITLVNVKESDLISVHGEQVRYAALVDQLLDHGASVVVLNLLDNWATEIIEEDNLAIQQVIQEHSDQVVLVTPTVGVSFTNVPEISTYHHLLPPFIGDDIQSSYNVTQIQGFYEFENEVGASFESPARRAHLTGLFYYNDPSFGQTTGQFQSALALAHEKYQLHHSIEQPSRMVNDQRKSWSLKIPFAGKAKPFSSLDFEDICQPTSSEACEDNLQPNVADQLRQNIIIVGFVSPEGNTKVILPVQSPFGTQTPGIEVQANILASLLSDTAYYIPPRWLVQVIIVLGTILISYGVDLRVSASSGRKNVCLPFILLMISAVHVCAAFLFFSQQLVFPIVLPTLTWLLSGLVLRIWLLYVAQQTLISRQQYEIAQLKSAESGAVILQTRKLLQRIASGIHEGPLQDLRLIMDKLELNLQTEPDTVVEKLSAVGQTIRHHLENIRNMANQLEVTPELRHGLTSGIRQYIDQLKALGKLTLIVQLDLQPFDEPLFNSEWLDAREDIFIFLKEAIANVIVHAQPPYGHATQVSVKLRIQSDQFMLVIENDWQHQPLKSGSEVVPYRRGGPRGGYGTQMMETVARELPEGKWQAIRPENEGYRVELTWRQLY